uniref:Uncharacterized protein n=1 Tax=Aplanochytrium stocchinoi TaxID=215587 RepID=A0A7S3LL71_9STRA|mmetsp:Transcript_20255/g.24559  ORF Transcript_20255/g.24559 Transcript_20255/m.24559 type:complete len:249 (+) Transcript_20255:334-1080(+)|eukprot:CAMPEP_0204823242 /NCGR_PEP_ID=MMETSP1346-20131115/1316_1 /ASSEMBLY_ACC=CAM_ASM_000771 /TAXON_ID=215587 /ORGANISM="Aplanochytrium stocchinoi, Strain GSBS06" /LENGTH=248 /DNA_ID=CAMNT_0051949799 /DNA_START=370 /DNA_END=1116 /DNA_ORIENTATION=-
MVGTYDERFGGSLGESLLDALEILEPLSYHGHGGSNEGAAKAPLKVEGNAPLWRKEYNSFYPYSLGRPIVEDEVYPACMFVNRPKSLSIATDMSLTSEDSEDNFNHRKRSMSINTTVSTSSESSTAGDVEGRRKKKRKQRSQVGQPRYTDVEDQALVQSELHIQLLQLLKGSPSSSDLLHSTYEVYLKRLDPKNEYPKREGSALFRHFKALKSRNRNLFDLLDSSTEFARHLKSLNRLIGNDGQQIKN